MNNVHLENPQNFEHDVPLLFDLVTTGLVVCVRLVKTIKTRLKQASLAKALKQIILLYFSVA